MAVVGHGVGEPQGAAARGRAAVGEGVDDPGLVVAVAQLDGLEVVVEGLLEAVAARLVDEVADVDDEVDLIVRGGARVLDEHPAVDAVEAGLVVLAAHPGEVDAHVGVGRRGGARTADDAGVAAGAEAIVVGGAGVEAVEDDPQGVVGGGRGVELARGDERGEVLRGRASAITGMVVGVPLAACARVQRTTEFSRGSPEATPWGKE